MWCLLVDFHFLLFFFWITEVKRVFFRSALKRPIVYAWGLFHLYFVSSFWSKLQIVGDVFPPFFPLFIFDLLYCSLFCYYFRSLLFASLLKLSARGWVLLLISIPRGIQVFESLFGFDTKKRVVRWGTQGRVLFFFPLTICPRPLLFCFLFFLLFTSLIHSTSPPSRRFVC